MQFSVSSWHFRKPEEWLALPHAHTIMCVAPEWTRGKRENLVLFAAPKELVFGGYTPEQYETAFAPMLRRREAAIRRFMQQHDGHHVILLCACPGESRAERFCHRYIVADYLRELGCQEVALPPRAPREPMYVQRCETALHTHHFQATLDPRYERCACGVIQQSREGGHAGH